MKILIKSGQVVDPINNINEVLDVLIDKGKIEKIAKSINAEGAEVIDAKGKIVAPGLVDLHVHLREPGREDEETIASGAKAAAKGGFTTVLAMPNTEPVCDNDAQVKFILEKAKDAVINVLPVGAISKTLKGEELAEIGDMAQAGIVAISDDGHPVSNAQLMRRALEYSTMFNIFVITHAEDLDLTADGVMNEGATATRLGLKGIPAESETVAIARDIALARMTKGKLHIAHVSKAGSVELIRQAKKSGLKITCETAPHYFTLTDSALEDYNTNLKVKPPIGTAIDQQTIIAGLKDGTIDAIATDHAPHAEHEKDCPFDEAAFGMIGLETALALTKKILDWKELIEKMSLNPAKIAGLDKGTLTIGQDADLIIIDPDEDWKVTKEDFVSCSKNSGFIGMSLKGRVRVTISGGKIAYKE